ncbi:hypothetical protein ACWOFR_03375 [Carnobacterium gallinarum]|uniref:hypothetical protein n=1 Tax=Carnobacterium gallinarum TaxID=2749 RepID=UPI000559745F|nr:hypothetical protein [Carnobacterium gallinarum]
MRTFRKAIFYLSSFIPLYLLLIIQNIKIRNTNDEILPLNEIIKENIFKQTSITIFWFGLFILILLSVTGIVLFFIAYGKADGVIGELSGVDFVREDTMGYIVTYIVPLLSMDISSPRSLLINFILFITIGTFYVKNDQLFMNPLYNLLGYNVFSANRCIYITKLNSSQLRTISKNKDKVNKKNIVGDIYIVEKIENH